MKTCIQWENANGKVSHAAAKKKRSPSFRQIWSRIYSYSQDSNGYSIFVFQVEIVYDYFGRKTSATTENTKLLTVNVLVRSLSQRSRTFRSSRFCSSHSLLIASDFISFFFKENFSLSQVKSRAFREKGYC